MREKKTCLSDGRGDVGRRLQDALTTTRRVDALVLDGPAALPASGLILGFRLLLTQLRDSLAS